MRQVIQTCSLSHWIRRRFELNCSEDQLECDRSNPNDYGRMSRRKSMNQRHSTHEKANVVVEFFTTERLCPTDIDHL